MSFDLKFCITSQQRTTKVSKNASFVERELSILKSIFCGNLEQEEGIRSIELKNKKPFVI